MDGLGRTAFLACWSPARTPLLWELLEVAESIFADGMPPQEVVARCASPPADLAAVDSGAIVAIAPAQGPLAVLFGDAPDRAARAQKISASLAGAGWRVIGLPCLSADVRERPLEGLRVLVTREAQAARPLLARLQLLGAEPVLHPAIRIGPPEDAGPLRAAVRRLSTFNWVVFTSRNGVDGFFQELGEAQSDLRELYGARLVAVGKGTARALREIGLRVHVIPAAERSSAIGAAIAEEVRAGERCLIIGPEPPDAALDESLRGLRLQVEAVAAYSTVEGGAQLRSDALDGVRLATYYSPSAVRGTLRCAGERARGIPAVAVGPVTAEACRENGIEVADVAAEPSDAAVTAAVLKFFGRV